MTTATPSAVNRSPFHHWHVARGARLVDSDGWQLPLAYTDPRDEAKAARESVGLADISAFAKLSLRGPGVPALAAALGSLAPRRVLTMDTGLACRLTDRCLYLLASSTSKASLIEQMPLSGELLQTNITSAYAGFNVIGPSTEGLISKLTSLDLSMRAFPDGTCAETELAGVQALLVRPRARAVPEIAVYVGWDVGEYVWDRVLESGTGLGLTPLGTGGLRMLHEGASLE